MAFIAGPYRWSFAGETLGVAEDSPRIEYFSNGEPIRADFFGGGRVDDIFTGITATISFVLQEFNAIGLQRLLTNSNAVNDPDDNESLPTATQRLQRLGRFDNVGCSYVDNRSDVLLGEAIESAACLSGVPGAGRTFLAFRAGIATGTPISWLMGGRLRNVPIRINLFPYARANAGTATMDGTVNQTSPIHVFEMFDDVPQRAPLKADAVGLIDFVALSSS